MKPSAGILNQRIVIDRVSTAEDILISALEVQSGGVEEQEVNIDSGEKEKWVPKSWNAEYELVVMMHLAGKRGTEIARLTGYTAQHVYNILATPQAIAIEEAVIAKRREATIDINDEIDKIQKLTVNRLRRSLEDDNTFSKAPLGFISKGIEVMKGTGEHLKNSPTHEVRNNTFILPPSVADRFLEGLAKSDQARLLLSGKNDEIEEAVVVGETTKEE